MINQSGLKVTTEVLWRAAVIFALMDTVFVIVMAKKIKPHIFRELRLPLVISSGIYWAAVWMLMVSFFWGPVYKYVFPEWARWLIPPVYGLLFAGISLLFWWISIRLPGYPTLNFCLLGGIWGMITHIWGIQRGLLEKPPMLQGVSPVAASVMPIFEFIFYWCVILVLASALRRSRHKQTRS
jgi:hypothetical protein